MKAKKSYKIKINSGAQAARFTVDLKKDLAKTEVEPIRMSRSEKIEARLEKLAEVDYGKILKNGKERVTKIWIPAFAGMTKSREVQSESNFKSKSLLDQLLFFSLGKFLFSLFYKICYAVGWLAVFILRLVYFVLSAAFKPIVKVLKFSYLKSRNIFVGIFSELPSGYHATQAVALTISAKSVKAIKKIKNKREHRLEPRFGFLRPVLVFASLLLIMVLPVKAFTFYKSLDSVKGKVLGVSESAIGSLISGGKAAADFDFKKAGENFSQAGENFIKAQNQLEEINSLIFKLASISPNQNIKMAAAAPHILKAGELGAAAGEKLSLAVSGLFSEQASLSRILADLDINGQEAVKYLNALSSELNQIDSEVLPQDYQADFLSLKQKISILNQGLNQFISLAESLNDFLGMNSNKRYLFVFQNNSELRASGGFIGSYAIIDFSKGELKNIEAPGGGSYDTDAGFLKRIKSPEPLSLVRADWHFWDANWWPDWPTSANKLAWFYENSDGSTVDGVIGLTPTVMERILEILGPIDMSEKYGLVFDANNFWLETQKLAEQKPNVTNEPKKIIGDLMNKIIEELPKRLNKDNLAPLLKAVEESLSDKNILLYFADEKMQKQIEEFGWDGKIKDTAGDYLDVINTNIAGGKSDRKIEQQIIHQAEIQPDGSVIDTLTIKRIHNAVNREPFVGVRNVDWLRIYVPLGSELIEANGFMPVDKIFFKEVAGDLQDDTDVYASEGKAITDEASGTKIYNEFNKTVFANWSQVDPGQATEIKLKYRLPFKINDEKIDEKKSGLDLLIEKAAQVFGAGEEKFYSYSLLAQKQPGMNSSIITSEIKLNDNFRQIWKYPGELSGKNFNEDITNAILLSGN